MELRDAIDQVMDWFDFDRVAQVMKILEWKWTGIGVPSNPELRSAARSLMTTAAKEMMDENLSQYTTATGGFSTTIYYDPVHGYEVDLKFILAEWSAFSGGN